MVDKSGDQVYYVGGCCDSGELAYLKKVANMFSAADLMKDIVHIQDQVSSSTPCLSPKPSLTSWSESNFVKSESPSLLPSSSPQFPTSSPCPVTEPHHIPSPGPSPISSLTLRQASNPSYQVSSSNPSQKPILPPTHNPSLTARPSHLGINGGTAISSLPHRAPQPPPHLSYVPVDLRTGGKAQSQFTMSSNPSPCSTLSEVSTSSTNYRAPQSYVPVDIQTGVKVESPFTMSSSQSPYSVPSEASTTSRRRRSIVWTEFEEKTIDGREYAICNTCNSKLTSGSRYGTRHLHSHMERCKRLKTNDIRQQILHQVKKESDKGRAEETRDCPFDQEVSRRDLVNAIILHGYPLNIVNHYGFQKFTRGLQPMFQMVSRDSIRKDILKTFDSGKDKTIRVFEKLNCRVAITTDIWTAKPLGKSYMAITAHFIDEEWLLHSRVVRFICILHSHNAEVLTEHLMDALLDLGLDRKLSTITVDNSRCKDAVIFKIPDKLDASSLLLDGSVLNMHCCANILHLIVNDGLQIIRGQIEKVRNCVIFWTDSPQRMDEFMEACHQLCVPYAKKLSLDVTTHWNSTLSMLQTALLYKDVFPCLNQQETHHPSLPSEHDWELVKEIVGKLQVFYNMAELFCGPTYTTLNCYFPKICEIKIAISKLLDSPLEIVQVMASQMKEKYEEYWGACHRIIGIACVLDPRYKMKLIEYFFKIIYGDEALVHVNKVRDDCYALQLEYQSKSGVNHSVGASSDCSQVASECDVDDLLSKYDLFVASHGHVKSEMDLYLEECVLPRTPDFDILSWWKTNGVKFPTLQKIASDILAIPASTAASKPGFGNDRVLSSHQSRLHHTTMEALMCTQNWSWDEINGTCSGQTQLVSIMLDEDADEDEDEDEDNDEKNQ